MFGNSKEYQDLQKLYVEKVSKPENIDEGVREFLGKINPFKKKKEEIVNKEKSTDTSTDPIKGFTPSKEIKAEREKIIKQREESRSKVKSIGPVVDDPITPEDEKKNYGKELNKIKATKEAEAKKREAEARAKEAFHNATKETDPSYNYIKSNEGPNRVARGLPAVPLKPVKSPMDQLMDQGNQKNRNIMKQKARLRNDAFKKRQQEFKDKKRLGKPAGRKYEKPKSMMNFDDSYQYNAETIEERLGGSGVSKKAAAGSIYPGKKGDGQTEDQDRGSGNKAKRRANEPVKEKSPTFLAYIKNKKEDKKEDKKESFDAYDVVLEYLLKSQQAATVEEANYVMTEMDAQTIRDIVEMEDRAGLDSRGRTRTSNRFINKDHQKFMDGVNKNLKIKSETELQNRLKKERETKTTIDN